MQHQPVIHQILLTHRKDSGVLRRFLLNLLYERQIGAALLLSDGNALPGAPLQQKPRRRNSRQQAQQHSGSADSGRLRQPGDLQHHRHYQNRPDGLEGDGHIAVKAGQSQCLPLRHFKQIHDPKAEGVDHTLHQKHGWNRPAAAGRNLLFPGGKPQQHRQQHHQSQNHRYRRDFYRKQFPQREDGNLGSNQSPAEPLPNPLTGAAIPPEQDIHQLNRVDAATEGSPGSPGGNQIAPQQLRSHQRQTKPQKNRQPLPLWAVAPAQQRQYAGKQQSGILGQHQQEDDQAHCQLVDRVLPVSPYHIADPGPGQQAQKAVNEDGLVIFGKEQQRPAENPGGKQQPSQKPLLHPAAQRHEKRYPKHLIGIVQQPLGEAAIQHLQKILHQCHPRGVGAKEGIGLGSRPEGSQLEQHLDDIPPVGKFVGVSQQSAIIAEGKQQLKKQKQQKPRGEEILCQRRPAFLSQGGEPCQQVQPGAQGTHRPKSGLQLPEHAEEEQHRHNGAARHRQQLFIFPPPPGSGIDAAGGQAEKEQNQGHSTTPKFPAYSQRISFFCPASTR